MKWPSKVTKDHRDNKTEHAMKSLTKEWEAIITSLIYENGVISRCVTGRLPIIMQKQKQE